MKIEKKEIKRLKSKIDKDTFNCYAIDRKNGKEYSSKKKILPPGAVMPVIDGEYTNLSNLSPPIEIVGTKLELGKKWKVE